MSVRILIGNIGTGKSLIARKFALRGEVVVNMVSISCMIGGGEYGLYDIQKKDIYHRAEAVIIQEALTLSYHVVIDRTNMDKKRRARYITLAREYGQDAIAYDFGEGDEKSLERRIKDSTVPASVWKQVHESMRQSYEKPELNEGFSLIIQAPKRYTYHAFDFDGTIVENKFPEIGELNQRVVDIMHTLSGDLINIIIIWTCRSGESELQMRKFLLDKKIPFDFINENPMVDFGSRKIFANEYIDDRCVYMADTIEACIVYRKKDRPRSVKDYCHLFSKKISESNESKAEEDL